MDLRFSVFLLFLSWFGGWIGPPLQAQDQAVLVVLPNARGSKGTLCGLCDHSGEPVGAKVIVRGYFSNPEHSGKKIVVTVTTSDETLMVRGEEVPIFHLVEGSEPRPFQEGEFDAMLKKKADLKRVTKDQYFLIDKDAAILIPRGWGMNEGLEPPLHLNGEQSELKVGLSVLKEDPSELEITSLKAYSEVKSELLQEKFPDFEPSEVKLGKVGELPAGFFQGPGTIGNVKGTIIGMAIQGSTHFYLLLGVVEESAPAHASAELVKVMKSFKERQ